MGLAVGQGPIALPEDPFAAVAAMPAKVEARGGLEVRVIAADGKHFHPPPPRAKSLRTRHGYADRRGAGRFGSDR